MSFGGLLGDDQWSFLYISLRPLWRVLLIYWIISLLFILRVLRVAINVFLTNDQDLMYLGSRTVCRVCTCSVGGNKTGINGVLLINHLLASAYSSSTLYVDQSSNR